ncbi:RraA family protein [Enterovirga sp.]|jgi:RraA family protein|uniref:RraA family protein n=1 Tax=Enterovirga sp. TaxID=2026350 RepID=UPI00262D9FA2|nr:RraA family protein [Enterovirga sp.]MDB5592902.1 methyltransferase [Enterovirga sp.]
MPIGFRIEPRAPALDPALVEALRGIPTSVLSDNMGRLFAAGGTLRPFHDGTAMIGMALTVRTRPGDNLVIHKAVDMAGPGDVIVVDGGGDTVGAVVGEILASLAEARGAAGFVIDGAIRDLDALSRSSLGVYARGVTPRGPYKDGPGEINVPIAVAGQIVVPGDVVIGDLDGVLAIPRHEAKALAELGRAQMAREAAMLAAIRDGTLDRSWVDETLRAKGAVV